MDVIRIFVCAVAVLWIAGCTAKPQKPGDKDVALTKQHFDKEMGSMRADVEAVQKGHKDMDEKVNTLATAVDRGFRSHRSEMQDLSARLGATKPPPTPGSPEQPQVAVTVTDQPQPSLTVQQQVEAGVAAAMQRVKEDEAARDAAAAAEEAKVRRFEEAARRGAADAINQALPNIQEALDQKMAALHEQGMDKNLQVTRGVIHQTLQEFYHSSQMKVMPELTVVSPPVNVVKTTQYYQYFVPGGCVTVWPYGYGGRVYWRVTPYNYYPYGR